MNYTARFYHSFQYFVRGHLYANSPLSICCGNWATNKYATVKLYSDQAGTVSEVEENPYLKFTETSSDVKRKTIEKHNEYLQMLMRSTKKQTMVDTRHERGKPTALSAEEHQAAVSEFDRMIKTLSQDKYREVVHPPEYYMNLVQSVNYSDNSLEAATRLQDARQHLPFDSLEGNSNDVMNSSLGVEFKFDLNKLMSVKPLVPAKAKTLCSYVNDSDTLKRLIKLNIDLSIISRYNPNIANAILRMDFERDLLPRILFLKGIGLTVNNITSVLNKHAFLFTEPIEDMQVRINYFKSKKFEPQCISTIVTHAPMILTSPVKLIDRHLGFIQKEFQLTGNELRSVIEKEPQLFYTKKYNMKLMQILMRDGMQLSTEDRRYLFTSCPRLLNQDLTVVQHNFEYLLHDMELPLRLILSCPDILRVNSFGLECKHSYLKFLQKNQYDRKKELFVPLSAFLIPVYDFCEKYAKTPVQVYREFVKTI